MESLNHTLAALKDVRGVEGSFYASRDGRILGRDLPRIFEGDPLDGVSNRLGRMLDALADVAGQHEGTLLRFEHHALLVRPTEHGLLCVLTTHDVNVPSLKRGASLVARRLPSPAALEPTREATPPPLPASTFQLPPPLAPPPLPRISAPPPLPPSAAAPRAASEENSAAGRLPTAPRTSRVSVPGAPQSPARRWRGSTLEDS